MYLLIITLNNYIYNSEYYKKKNTLTIDINRTKLDPPCLLMNENVFAIENQFHKPDWDTRLNDPSAEVVRSDFNLRLV